MKKVLTLVLALLLCLAIAGAALAETVYISSTGTGTMNVRKGPGKSYAVVGYVHHGDTVTVHEHSGEWSRVTIKGSGVTGWIKTKYFDGTTKELCNGKREVDLGSAKSIKLRKGPGTKYAKVGYVYASDTVKVLYFESDWVKVTVTASGKTGWIMEKYVGDKASDVPDADEGTPAGTGKSLKVRRVTANSGLNVRKGAGDGYPVIDTLPKGTPLKILGSSGKWYKISTFDGLTGWVFKKYTAAGAYATVTAKSGLNVRKGPGTKYAKLNTLPKGTLVSIDSVKGNWAHITSPKPKGYMSLNYLAF